jgi:HD superfamily phosphohydrolase YqeK
MNELIERASKGVLPGWACVSDKRRGHISRVAALLSSWAIVLAPKELAVWSATAWLHDALRNAESADLRAELGSEWADWPDALLHGPAAARRIRLEAPDAPRALLDAVTYHTVGHECLGLLGRALYLADFLEPGRKFDPVGRAAQRARMPADLNGVLREVARTRIVHLFDSGSPIRLETAGFWNSIVAG